MGQKIKITESQLKKVVNMINEDEEQFDSFIQNYHNTKLEPISLPKEEVRLLATFAKVACNQSKNPDCEDIEDIIQKHRLLD